ncbi:unnamed protein product [Cochlearia groenlandica]
MASTPAPKAATAVSDLKLGRSDQFIVCRLLRYWDSKNVEKQGEFMGITVLLLDTKIFSKPRSETVAAVATIWAFGESPYHGLIEASSLP